MGYSNGIEDEATRGARKPARRLQRMLNVAMRGSRFGTSNAIVRNLSPRGLGGTTKRWLARGEETCMKRPAIGLR